MYFSQKITRKKQSRTLHGPSKFLFNTIQELIIQIQHAKLTYSPKQEPQNLKPRAKKRVHYLWKRAKGEATQWCCSQSSWKKASKNSKEEADNKNRWNIPKNACLPTTISLQVTGKILVKRLEGSGHLPILVAAF